MRVLLLSYSVIGLCYAHIEHEQTSLSGNLTFYVYEKDDLPYRNFILIIEEAQKEGYACNSSIKNLGLMRPNERRSSFIPNDCREAHCTSKGIIDHYT